MTEVVRSWKGDVIDVSEREQIAFERGRLRGQDDEGQDAYNDAPLSGEMAGESVPELLGDLWIDLDGDEIPDWYLGTILDHYEKGYQSAFEGRSWCDECGTLISALDGVATDTGLAFCGSFRGNGCGDRFLEGSHVNS